MPSFCDILLKLKFEFQMLHNTVSSDVALYVGNRNTELGSQKQTFILPGYSLYSRCNMFHEGPQDFSILSRYTVVMIKLVSQHFVFVGCCCVGTAGWSPPARSSCPPTRDIWSKMKISSWRFWFRSAGNVLKCLPTGSFHQEWWGKPLFYPRVGFY